MTLHANFETTCGHVNGDAMDGGSVGQLDGGRHCHWKAHSLTALAALPGDRGGNHEDNKVEGGPDQVHHNGASVVAVVHSCGHIQWPGLSSARERKESRNCAEHADDVDRDHHKEGLCDARVEEPSIDDAAFCGHLEAAEPGIDQRE